MPRLAWCIGGFLINSDDYVMGKQKVNLQAFNGDKLQVDGCATIKFKLGGRKFQHKFYVVDGLNRNVILGRA